MPRPGIYVNCTTLQLLSNAFENSVGTKHGSWVSFKAWIFPVFVIYSGGVQGLNLKLSTAAYESILNNEIVHRKIQTRNSLTHFIWIKCSTIAIKHISHTFLYMRNMVFWLTYFHSLEHGLCGNFMITTLYQVHSPLILVHAMFLVMVVMLLFFSLFRWPNRQANDLFLGKICQGQL